MKTSFLKIFAVVALISFSSCKDKAKEAESVHGKIDILINKNYLLVF